jgi:hypothetical protein
MRLLCSICQKSMASSRPGAKAGCQATPNRKDSPSSGCRSGLPLNSASTTLPKQSKTSSVTGQRCGSSSTKPIEVTLGSYSSRNVGGRKDVPQVARNRIASSGRHNHLGLVPAVKQLGKQRHVVAKGVLQKGGQSKPVGGLLHRSEPGPVELTAFIKAGNLNFEGLYLTVFRAVRVGAE